MRAKDRGATRPILQEDGATAMYRYVLVTSIRWHLDQSLSKIRYTSAYWPRWFFYSLQNNFSYIEAPTR